MPGAMFRVNDMDTEKEKNDPDPNFQNVYLHEELSMPLGFKEIPVMKLKSFSLAKLVRNLAAFVIVEHVSAFGCCCVGVGESGYGAFTMW